MTLVLSNNFDSFVILSQLCHEQTLKISSQYLERFQIYRHLTEKFWQLSAYSRTNVLAHFWWLPICKLILPGKSYIPLFKALVERIYTIWSKVVMESYKWIQVIVVVLTSALKTLAIHHFYDVPSFFPDSRGSLLGLSNGK